MKAYRLSGAYATPWGNGLVVGIRATSASVAASMSETLWSFLFVTITHLPSGEGSTLYAPCPAGIAFTRSSVPASSTINSSLWLQATYNRVSSGDTDTNVGMHASCSTALRSPPPPPPPPPPAPLPPSFLPAQRKAPPPAALRSGPP